MLELIFIEEEEEEDDDDEEDDDEDDEDEEDEEDRSSSSSIQDSECKGVKCVEIVSESSCSRMVKGEEMQQQEISLSLSEKE